MLACVAGGIVIPEVFSCRYGLIMCEGERSFIISFLSLSLSSFLLICIVFPENCRERYLKRKRGPSSSFLVFFPIRQFPISRKYFQLIAE